MRTLHRRYAAAPASISIARRELEAFAARLGVGSEELARVTLAASEALTNAVEHAYRHRDGEIELLAAPTDDALEVLIADRGAGLRPGRSSDGLGLGFALMHDSCDALTLACRSGGGVEVRMRFEGAFRAAPRQRAQPRGSVASASRPAAPVFSTTT